MTASSDFVPPRPEPPKSPLPFFRFLRAVRTNALTIWTEDAYQEDLTARRFLGRTNMLVNDPDVIRHVLIDNYTNYRRSPASIRILQPITGDGLLLSEGDDWRHQRRTIAPALAPRSLPLLVRHVPACTEQAIAMLAAGEGQPVDLLAAMQSLALDIAGRSMFSLEVGQYGAAMRRLLTDYGNRFARPNLFDMVLPASVPTFRDLQRRRFNRRWMGLMREIMQARLAAQPSDVPRDLFDLLVAARDPETGSGFSQDQLRDQVATMILAGHETTAVALFWALLLLARSPEQQELIAREVRDIEITPDNAMSVLPSLVRTRAVISETLRLYPPAFTIVREAIGADRVGSVELPAGAILMISPWVLGRHRKHWHEPDRFDPARFMPDTPPPSRFAYMPFGLGPRVCVGAQFALAEATLVLASLIRTFDVTLDPADTPQPVAVVTTQPDHPPAFALRRRPVSEPRPVPAPSAVQEPTGRAAA